MQYENRTDYRVFDVMVQSIANASQTDIKNALTTAHEQTNNLALNPTKRAIWKDVACMLRRQLRKY